MTPHRFFVVSYKRLLLCSIFSFGLYEIYWFYRNWLSIKEAEESKIMPFWRAIFTLIWCYPLFKKIYETSQSRGYKASESYLWVAIIYIIVMLTHNLPTPLWLISMFSVLVLIPVQRAAFAANLSIQPEAAVEKQWTRGQLIILAFSAFLWGLNLLAFLLPEAATGA